MFRFRFFCPVYMGFPDTRVCVRANPPDARSDYLSSIRSVLTFRAFVDTGLYSSLLVIVVADEHVEAERFDDS